MKYSLFFPRKGDANMWWIIIGAVIALVVMIVLLVFFTGRSATLESGILDCAGKGGVCVSDDQSCVREEGSEEPGTISRAFQCSSEQKADGKTVCCFGADKNNP